jgi:hypothetical protein
MFKYPFSFREDTLNQTTGLLELDEPLSYHQKNEEGGFYRPGKISLAGGKSVDLVLYHNAATERFIYLRNCAVEKNLLDIVGADPKLFDGQKTMTLPGQLCLGADRGKLIGEAIHTVFQSPVLEETFKKYCQENIAVYPIAREGLKYEVQDAIYANHGFYCDEIVLDAHHVFDSSVPVYNRTVELTLFKDKDLDVQQKENIAVAFFADSIASGLVMKEVVARVKERFENLKQVEVISPLAQTELPPDLPVRVHVFETLLNALPPDYYYSAHFNIPEFHFRPEAEQQYRAWWGQDEEGKCIADTACAGYGWSEAFYSPRKQIQMMNSQLQLRHNLTIADIVKRNHGK